jgi:hypothetical protein
VRGGYSVVLGAGFLAIGIKTQRRKRAQRAQRGKIFLLCVLCVLRVLCVLCVIFLARIYFLGEYLERIRPAYPVRGDRVIFPFRRLFVIAYQGKRV